MNFTQSNHFFPPMNNAWIQQASFYDKLFYIIKNEDQIHEVFIWILELWKGTTQYFSRTCLYKDHSSPHTYSASRSVTD